MIQLPKKPELPVLDLKEVAADEYFEAIRGFVSKQGELGNKSVIVVGNDGVSRLHNTSVLPGKESVMWLVGSTPAPEDAQVFVTEIKGVSSKHPRIQLRSAIPD